MSLRELTIDELLLVSGGEGVTDSAQSSYDTADLSGVLSDAGAGAGGYLGGEVAGAGDAAAGTVLGGVAGRALGTGLQNLAGPGVSDDAAAIAAGMQNAADSSGSAYSGNSVGDVGDSNNGPGADSDSGSGADGASV